MRIGRKPQERNGRFFRFFCKVPGSLAAADKSDVENQQAYDERQRGGLEGQNMMEEEVLGLPAGIFRGAFSGLWKQFDGCHGFVSKPA
ncbi:hypothetical protein LP421_10955 [Rhizobium sp. RCAM05350]|nr:hypothetical protein LP421_10955 [Rhizobium sp. RCAM05350]